MYKYLIIYCGRVNVDELINNLILKLTVNIILIIINIIIIIGVLARKKF